MWQAFEQGDAALAGMDYFLLGKGALLVRERSLVSSALQAWASVSSGASLEASFDDDDGDGAYVFSEPSDAEEEEDVGSLAATISDATALRLAATLNRLSPASSDANDARSPRSPAARADAPSPRSPAELYPGEPAENLLARLGRSPYAPDAPTPGPIPPTPSPGSAHASRPSPPPRAPVAVHPQRRAVNACRSLSRRASAHARDAAARLSRLLALRRRDAKRRALGRWLADVAGERATREARAALDRSLDAAEARRLGAVALAKALTRKVDDATAAGLDVARLRRAKAVERRRGDARVFAAACRGVLRASAGRRAGVALRRWRRAADATAAAPPPPPPRDVVATRGALVAGALAALVLCRRRAAREALRRAVAAWTAAAFAGAVADLDAFDGELRSARAARADADSGRELAEAARDGAARAARRAGLPRVVAVALATWRSRRTGAAFGAWARNAMRAGLARDRAVWKVAALARLRSLVKRVGDLEASLETAAAAAPAAAAAAAPAAEEAPAPRRRKVPRRPAHREPGFIPPPCCEHVPYRLLSVKAQVPPTPPRLDRKKPPPPRARSPEPPPKTYVVTLPF